MDGQTGLLIFYIVCGFFGFVFISAGITIWVLWRRRKLTFTNFLSDSGQWERASWMPHKIDKEFVYDNETYKFDITKCTRDNLNRPIAHYYKGNPEQQLFDYSKGNKKVKIDTLELTQKDFSVLMLSKVLRDIFQDDEVMNMLMILLIAVIVVGVAISILVLTRNPAVTLADNNQTVNLIARACKQALSIGIQRV